MQCTKTSFGTSILVILTMVLLMMYYTDHKPTTHLESHTSVPHHRHKTQGNITEDCKIHVESLVRKMMESYGLSEKTRGEGTLNSAKNVSTRGSNTTNIIDKNVRKVVLAYTMYFGQKPWGWMKNTHEFNHWQGVKCPYYNCELTFERRDRPRSDALIFHARDMPFIDTLRYALERKSPTQKWIYFAMESPMNNPLTSRFNSMFNWIMTYRSDSDIFRPYSYYFESKHIPLVQDVKEYMEGKDRLVFWASSRCGLMRDKFVKKLLEYMKVDVFGACKKAVGASNKDKCPKNSERCEKKLKRYKFELALENSYCVDYVTEKYWDALKRGVVPVVLGGANYSKKDIAIPGSFINAMDFKTVKKLAEYLIYLHKNETAYLEYFKWKNKYRIVDYPPWNCILCARLHLDNKPKVYTWLDTIWNANKQCGIHRKELQKMVRPRPRTFE
ncbi:alpha-(1,3)-fucosyltransferase 6 [Exaiptasia diaphana]|uniref:Fucosyltransferase n=1 Tax=Exaiptasia diaphana TaxID=2652724 RepID=A0A913YF51_EXADI|nr:alpha-(1,3)-fucosyltransferase 6 [Exaiptasia diaphana]XP_028513081.1 alpha-(1,3)-fucosyltransferase 6 [Exaiptasia diaphana]KXJ18039.1 Alpha-(1,3)-fucosyltransferase C [Exaiptasia diaphana]